MEKKELAKKILQTLEGQRFADWYNDGGRFDDFITGDATGIGKIPTREEILEDIISLFHLDAR